MFFCAFGKISKNIIFWQHFPMRLILKFICEFWEVFQNTFYRTPLRNCLFHVQVAVFQPTDTVKNYFTGAYSSTVYKNTRSSHSKAFIYLKSLKIICEEVNLQWSCEMPTCKLPKKSFTYLPLWILPSFFKNASRLLLPKRLWNCARKISFRKYKQKVVLLVIYLFSYSSFKSTFFMLNVAFDFVLVRLSSSKLEFIAIQRLQKHFFLSCVFW